MSSSDFSPSSPQPLRANRFQQVTRIKNSRQSIPKEDPIPVLYWNEEFFNQVRKVLTDSISINFNWIPVPPDDSAKRPANNEPTTPVPLRVNLTPARSNHPGLSSRGDLEIVPDPPITTEPIIGPPPTGPLIPLVPANPPINPSSTVPLAPLTPADTPVVPSSTVPLTPPVNPLADPPVVPSSTVSLTPLTPVTPPVNPPAKPSTFKFNTIDSFFREVDLHENECPDSPIPYFYAHFHILLPKVTEYNLDISDLVNRIPQGNLLEIIQAPRFFSEILTKAGAPDLFGKLTNSEVPDNDWVILSIDRSFSRSALSTDNRMIINWLRDLPLAYRINQYLKIIDEKNPPREDDLYQILKRVCSVGANIPRLDQLLRLTPNELSSYIIWLGIHVTTLNDLFKYLQVWYREGMDTNLIHKTFEVIELIEQNKPVDGINLKELSIEPAKSRTSFNRHNPLVELYDLSEDFLSTQRIRRSIPQDWNISNIILDIWFRMMDETQPEYIKPYSELANKPNSLSAEEVKRLSFDELILISRLKGYQTYRMNRRMSKIHYRLLLDIAITHAQPDWPESRPRRWSHLITCDDPNSKVTLKTAAKLIEKGCLITPLQLVVPHLYSYLLPLLDYPLVTSLNNFVIITGLRSDDLELIGLWRGWIPSDLSNVDRQIIIPKIVSALTVGYPSDKMMQNAVVRYQSIDQYPDTLKKNLRKCYYLRSIFELSYHQETSLEYLYNQIIKLDLGKFELTDQMINYCHNLGIFPSGQTLEDYQNYLDRAMDTIAIYLQPGQETENLSELLIRVKKYPTTIEFDPEELKKYSDVKLRDFYLSQFPKHLFTYSTREELEELVYQVFKSEDSDQTA